MDIRKLLFIRGKDLDSDAYRQVVLINSTSLVLILLVILLVVIRLFSTIDFKTNNEWLILAGAGICVIPILLNRVRLIALSGMFLCWYPFIYNWLVYVYSPDRLVEDYNSIRFYMLSYSCLPYLLFRPSQTKLFLIGVMPSALSFLLFPLWLELLGFDLSQGDLGNTFYVDYVRSVISFATISGFCFSLRYIIDQTEQRNFNLIHELEKRNRLTEEYAEARVKQLNEQLMINLEDLMQREIVMNKSQQIAKLGTWEYDTVGGVLFWSDVMYDIFGLDKSFDLQQMNLHRHLFGENGSLVRDAFERLIRVHETYDFTLPTVTPLGYQKWVRIYGFPVLEDGKLVSVGGIVHDITRYKQAEEKIKEAERNYRALFEQATDAIMITDLNGTLVNVNEGLCKMFGYAMEELINKPVSLLIDEKDFEENPLSLEMLASGLHLFNRRAMKHRDGTIIQVEANIKRIDDNRIMAIARDVSSRIQVEFEKEQARILLRNRNRDLTVLYKASQLLNQADKEFEIILKELVDYTVYHFDFT